MRRVVMVGGVAVALAIGAMTAVVASSGSVSVERAQQAGGTALTAQERALLAYVPTAARTTSKATPPVDAGSSQVLRRRSSACLPTEIRFSRARRMSSSLVRPR